MERPGNFNERNLPHLQPALKCGMDAEYGFRLEFQFHPPPRGGVREKSEMLFAELTSRIVLALS